MMMPSHRRRVLLDAAKRFLSSGNSSSPPLSSLKSPSILDGRHDDAEFLSSQLHSKGFVPTTSQLLSLETTAMIKDRMNRLFHGQFDTGVYPDEWHWRAGISKPNVTREICNSWKADTKIASIVLDEKIGRFIASVMGWSSVRIAQDDLVWKVPSTQQYTDDSTVGFHQDSAYISNQFEPYDNNSVTLWIALDDADECNGCLEYSVGSQKWRPLLHRIDDHSNTTTSTESSEISDFHSSDSSSYRNGVSVAAQLAGVSQNIVEAVVVKEGFGVLHHQDVWHGSNANKSPTRHRRALVAHYIRGDVSFRQKGANYIYGRYKRHNSVELDETFFPIIYGKERSKWLDDFLTK